MTPPSPGIRYLAATGLFAAGLAVGWLGGMHHTANDPGAAATQTGASASRSGSGPAADGRNSSGRAGNNAADARPLAPAGSQEFGDSVRSIFREVNETKRMAMFEKMLARASPAHLAEIVTLVHENDLAGNASNGEWSRLWQHWGDTDALGALQFIAGKDWTGWNEMAPSEAKRQAITNWVQTDPTAALQYFSGCGDIEKGDRSLVFPLVRGLANEDPDAAAQWLFKSGLGMRDEFRAVVDSLRRQRGMDGADAWFDQVSQSGAPAKDLAGLAQSIVSSRQDFEPEKAAAWVDAHLQEPWLDASGVVDSTARAYVARDPEAAMNWAQDKVETDAASITYSQWCRKDLQGATGWLDSHTDSPAYPMAATLGVQYLATKDPDAATRIAQTIPNEAARNNALGYIQAIQAQTQQQQQEHQRLREAAQQGPAGH
jgi:hypothetical protein